MRTPTLENISKDVLHWSYQRAGLAQEQSFALFPLLEDWLNDTKRPTFCQLKKYAAKVNVPIGFLFLDEPLAEKMPFPIQNSDNQGNQENKSNNFDLDVYDIALEIGRRQDWLEDYLIDNEIDTCNFVGSISLNTSIAEAVKKLSTTLKLSPNLAFDLKEIETALDLLTSRLEEAGVFIMYSATVNNNPSRPLKLTQCRGFALANKVVPYIFVNTSDSDENQIYTVINECVHLMLGLTVGHVSGSVPIENEEESFCDRVTKEFLLPSETFHSQSLPIKKKIKKKPQDLYDFHFKRIGRRFAYHVNNAVQNRMLSYTEAYRLTGLYGRDYQDFMKKLMTNEGFGSLY